MSYPPAPKSVAPTTRDRILAAAVQVFAESGYDGATVRAICARAAANGAAVSYYFGGKEALYRAVFDLAFRRLRRLRRPYLPSAAPPEERLRSFVQASFDELLLREGDDPQGPPVAALILREMARPTAVLNWVVETYLHADAAELQAIVGALLGKAATPERVRNAAASVLGQVYYYYYVRPISERLNPGQPAPEERRDALVEHVTRFCLGGIEALGRGG